MGTKLKFKNLNNWNKLTLEQKCIEQTVVMGQN